ncbi:MAG: hypothetical protein U9Q82_14550, partial [Chloroflexota bacterium]|nr:hypothetical protein [Chloroflexota bacterium]
ILRQPDPMLFGPRSRLYYWGLTIVATVGVLLFFIFSRSSPASKRWGAEAVTISVAALILGPIPFWVTGLDIRLNFPFDRLTLPMMLGASLLLVAVLELLIKKKTVKVLLISLIIGLSVGFHYQNSITYRRDWQHQISFFQQLTWRIPALEPNTAILSNQLSATQSTDNSLTAPLNWTYAPDFSSGDMPLFMYYIELRFGREQTFFDKDTTLSRLYRFFPFEGSPQQALVLYHAPPACLRVLDDAHHHYYPLLPSYMREVLPYSHPDRIITDAESAATLPGVLAKYPQTKSWCYYFEKADLARQRGDWEQVAQLGDIAFPLDDSPNHASERLPFIEGYAHTGQIARAEALTFEALEINKFIGPMLCEAWERIEASTPASTQRDEALERINQAMDCDLY